MLDLYYLYVRGCVERNEGTMYRFSHSCCQSINGGCTSCICIESGVTFRAISHLAFLWLDKMVLHREEWSCRKIDACL